MSIVTSEFLRELEKYCLTQMVPYLEEDDESEQFRAELYQGLADLGVAGLTTSEEFGGLQACVFDLCQVLETVAKYSVSYAVTLSVSTMVQSLIDDYGTPEQKKRFLAPLAAGSIGSFCLSESHSGSDAGAMKSTAKPQGSDYILNGSKMWITSAGVSSTYLIMARTGTKDDEKNGVSAFIVPADQDGLVIGKKEKKMGWRSSPTCEVLLQQCRVSQENRLGPEGQGLKQALAALDKGRITIGAIAVGLAESALSETMRYTQEREQFGQSIFSFQGNQFLLAELATELQAARLLVHQAARLYDEGRADRKLSSMAKLKATEVAMELTTQAVQLHGGVGYTKEYPVERFMRDAKVLQIVEGTNQIQKIVIAQQLKKEYS